MAFPNCSRGAHGTTFCILGFAADRFSPSLLPGSDAENRKTQ